MASFIPVSAGLSGWAFVKAWTNFRLLTRGQWIEAEIVYVREDTNGDGDPRFYPEVAYTLRTAMRSGSNPRSAGCIRSTTQLGYASGTTQPSPDGPVCRATANLACSHAWWAGSEGPSSLWGCSWTSSPDDLPHHLAADTGLTSIFRDRRSRRTVTKDRG